MRWQLSHKYEPEALALANRHYNRQKVGSPQFCPPGRGLVLVVPREAFWVTSWPKYVKHAWPGTWACTAFRNERRDLHLSSELILEAIAATRSKWEPPPEGMITFVDRAKTKRKRDPGRCYLKAGFHVSGTRPCCADKPRETGKGLVTLHLSPDEMPSAHTPLPANYYEVVRRLK